MAYKIVGSGTFDVFEDDNGQAKVRFTSRDFNSGAIVTGVLDAADPKWQVFNTVAYDAPAGAQAAQANLFSGL